MAPLRDKWVRRFVINETTSHKQGFTIYKVTSVVYLKSSPDTASKVSVWKRYNDFKKLHASLKLLHETLKIKERFPQFAKPKYFGRFEAEVVEERRECAVKFLEFIARHSSLFTSDIFVKFFETSLGEDCTVDCSQSLSSDTSEDDKSVSLEHSDPCLVDSARNTVKNSINESTMKDSSSLGDRQVVPTNLINDIKIDYSISPEVNKKYQTVNNNNNNNSSVVEKSNDYLSWLVEGTKVDRLEEDVENDWVKINKDTDLIGSVQDTGQYILIAAAHMSAGFQHESIAEYDEAYMQYKLGISNLRHGVQKDPVSPRRLTIIDKIAKYSERADRLYNRHLNCNISMISKPVSELQYYKVLRVMGSVMLVKHLHHESTRVIKTVQKPAGVQEDISKYILRGKVPYMVQLHACIQTETTVFLILQFASGGKLWDYLKTQYALPDGWKTSSRKKSYTRSSSCEAIIHLNPERRMNTSRNGSNSQLSSVQSLEEAVQISPSFEANELLGSAENLGGTNTDDSLQKLEEECGTSSMHNTDLPTTQLLAKAQQLLRSVDATIKKGNSIASRLNESGRLLYENTEQANGGKDIKDTENTEEISDASELSTSDSCTDDLSTISDKVRQDTTDHVAVNSPTLTQNYLSEIVKAAPEKKFDPSKSSKTKNGQGWEEMYSFNVSLHHDDDSGIEMEQELWRVPETILRSWAAQMLLALEALHQQQVVISDLRPENLLVTEDGKILLNYVVPRQSPELSRYQKPYTAPELCMYLAVVPATPAADVWSFGVILYELFTGIPFQSRHPGPFHSHSIVSIPNELSDNAKFLLTNILRFEPTERLTIPELKQLPYFDRIDWRSLLNA